MAQKKKKKKNTKAPGDQSQTIAENRRARHRFEILEQLECGVMLVGSEVKSCLLYTSPSPRDRTRSRMPSSA